MVSFELRINKIRETFAGYGVVVVLLPNTVIGSGYSVFPYSVRAASEPFHAFCLLFGERECQSEVINLFVKELTLELSAVATVEQIGRAHV